MEFYAVLYVNVQVHLRNIWNATLCYMYTCRYTCATAHGMQHCATFMSCVAHGMLRFVRFMYTCVTHGMLCCATFMCTCVTAHGMLCCATFMFTCVTHGMLRRASCMYTAHGMLPRATCMYTCVTRGMLRCATCMYTCVTHGMLRCATCTCVTHGCESKRFGIEQVLVDIPFNTPFNTLLNRRVPIVQYPPFNTLVQLVYLPFSFVLVMISRVAENSIEAKIMIGKIQNDLFHLLAYSTHTVILSATGSATGFLR